MSVYILIPRSVSHVLLLLKQTLKTGQDELGKFIFWGKSFRNSGNFFLGIFVLFLANLKLILGKKTVNLLFIIFSKFPKIKSYPVHQVQPKLVTVAEWLRYQTAKQEVCRPNPGILPLLKHAYGKSGWLCWPWTLVKVSHQR